MTIAIDPVELFVGCHCVFVDLCLGVTKTPLVISCTMRPVVELYQNVTFLLVFPPLMLLSFPPFLLLLLFNESAPTTLLFVLVAFGIPVESIFMCNGWFYFTFEINYLRYHCLRTTCATLCAE